MKMILSTKGIVIFISWVNNRERIPAIYTKMAKTKRNSK